MDSQDKRWLSIIASVHTDSQYKMMTTNYCAHSHRFAGHRIDRETESVTKSESVTMKAKVVFELIQLPSFLYLEEYD